MLSSGVKEVISYHDRRLFQIVHIKAVPAAATPPEALLGRAVRVAVSPQRPVRPCSPLVEFPSHLHLSALPSPISDNPIVPPMFIMSVNPSLCKVLAIYCVDCVAASLHYYIGFNHANPQAKDCSPLVPRPSPSPTATATATASRLDLAHDQEQQEAEAESRECIQHQRLGLNSPSSLGVWLQHSNLPRTSETPLFARSSHFTSNTSPSSLTSSHLSTLLSFAPRSALPTPFSTPRDCDCDCDCDYDRPSRLLLPLIDARCTEHAPHDSLRAPVIHTSPHLPSTPLTLQDSILRHCIAFQRPARHPPDTRESLSLSRVFFPSLEIPERANDKPSSFCTITLLYANGFEEVALVTAINIDSGYQKKLPGERKGIRFETTHEISSKRDAKGETSKAALIVPAQIYERNVTALLVCHIGLGRRRRRLHVFRRYPAFEAAEPVNTHRSMLSSTADFARSPGEHSTAAMEPKRLYGKLLDAYIVPNGHREVNLPSNVRDRLVSLPCEYAPPDPSELDPAVKIIFELMDESVLVPFLNSVGPPRSTDSHSSPWTSDESMADAPNVGSLDDASSSSAHLHKQRTESPPASGTGHDVISQSYTGPSPRISHQSHLSAAFGRASRISTHTSGSSGTLSGSGPESLTDDSTDSHSPSSGPMTPPSTPPTSNAVFPAEASPGTSPHRNEGSSWKKMGAKFGFKKTRSTHGSGSIIAPMEHPVSGLSRPRGVRKNPALLNGGTSLKLSEGDLSPVLEAHPGSPVDISDHPRPSLAASLQQRLYHGTDAEIARFERKARLAGKKENPIRRDGVAAKSWNSVGDREEKNKNEAPRFPNKCMQVAEKPFFIPAKIQEQDEIQPETPEEPTQRLSIDTEMSMQFDFKTTENGTWISANPLANESRSSLSTVTTYMTNSTVLDDRMSGISHGALTVDTSIASSAASMMSSVSSIQSATTTGSSDVYGWEEELDRKESIESSVAWQREVSRRLPSGGRTYGPRLRNGMTDLQYKRADGKRKSLLYRVLNLHGSRRGSMDDIPPVPAAVSPVNGCPTTSA
ncbi:hypothetical protein G7Y89_g756 [Cudoniella acicularis]|uniref:RGS domain-containing protein n=1 Tax=Cudoniella acicularis TaxID=354080 RepID=A0A8H4RWK6_9HELO|nr:hypothetical protein G7Y89_g756 [Cudoniella acicularis]